MNEARRKRLQEAINAIDMARGIIEEVRDEEQDAFDALPEGLQQGEAGEKMEGAVEGLGDAANNCEEAVTAIEQAKE